MLKLSGQDAEVCELTSVLFTIPNRQMSLAKAEWSSQADKINARRACSAFTKQVTSRKERQTEECSATS